MKQNNLKFIIIKLCILAVSMCVLSGCAEKDTGKNQSDETEVVEESKAEEDAKEESGSGTEAEKEETHPVEETVQVDNVKDFLEAIAPGVTIVFSPDYYNLSEYTEEIWSTEGEEWNRTHPYVQLRECFDGGIEVVVQNVDEIFIAGDLESETVTELVVETRYGAVLNFEDCTNIILNGLTMGHTQAGACDESVITFSNSTDIHLAAMDLYGCGMYGFTAMNESGNIYLQSCTIRDCEAGPFYITEPAGRI